MDGLENVEDVRRCELVAQALESGESAGKTGGCHARLADRRTEVHEIYAAPFLYGGEVRGAMLLAESGAIDAYARSIADLFARDFGLAVATLIERYVRRSDAMHEDEPTAIPLIADVPVPGSGELAG
jgi:hypothetical protein